MCECYKKPCGCCHQKQQCKICKHNDPQNENKSDTSICHNLSGNLLLSEQVPNLQIWKGRMKGKTIVSISIYNSTLSVGSILVQINRKNDSPVEFIVPSGNTLSETIDGVDSITVFQTEEGGTEGKYSLNVYFPLKQGGSIFIFNNRILNQRARYI